MVLLFCEPGCKLRVLEDLVLAEDRTTEADRELIMEGGWHRQLVTLVRKSFTKFFLHS